MKKKIEMAKKSPKEQPQSILPAERTGFEPASQFCRLHAFQACLFNHSSTSPIVKRVQR